MKKIIRQTVGIDVSQKTLDVTFGQLDDLMDVSLFFQRSFKNDQEGFIKLLEMVVKIMDGSVPVRFVMEATGVYHEKLAYFIHGEKHPLTIVLPNKISSFMRTLTIKTITDKTCSEAIARFGLERKLEDWNPPKVIYRSLRQLTRERDQLVEERTVIKNQLHAEKKEAYPFEKTIKRLLQRIAFLSKQEADIKSDMESVIKNHNDVDGEIKYMTSIPGIGRLTAIILLAETNGFELIRNKKQLVSYAGLDVREKVSGTSVRGIARISKKGNTRLRKALYLPSITSIRWNEQHTNVYARIVQKHGIKKKGLVAIQRRLLELSFVLFKTKTYFDKEYEQKNSAQPKLDAIAD